MQRYFLLSISILIIVNSGWAQKKPLDHSVYDGWQRVGERVVSADGKWAAFTVDPQEGDGKLIVRSLQSVTQREFERGANAQFSYEGRFLVFKIKARYAATREAKIKKKKPEEMPKDSLGIWDFAKETLTKIAMVKGFKMPAKHEGLLAIQLASLEKAGENAEAASELLVRDLLLGAEKKFARISDYVWAEKGGVLVLEQTKAPKDSLGQNRVLLYRNETSATDTLSTGGNDFRGYCFSEDGAQLAFLAERDARPKELMKYYRIYYYQQGMDTVQLLADRNSAGLKLGYTISEFSNLRFSKNGQRLFFGTAPISAIRDTSLVELDLVKLDVWHYKDDYLQTQQLYNLKNEQERNYLALIHLNTRKIVQLGSPQIPQVYLAAEGDNEWAYGITDVGNRIEAQWKGATKKTIYRFDVNTGDTVLVKKNLEGVVFPSFIAPSGNSIIWYDFALKQYVSWQNGKTSVFSRSIPFPLYDEKNDVPAPASPYGIAGWLPGDTTVLIYDKFDAWKTEITGKIKAIKITPEGRSKKESYRYLKLEAEEKYVLTTSSLSYWRFQQDINKSSGLAAAIVNKGTLAWKYRHTGSFQYGMPVKSRNNDLLIYTKESYVASPDLYSWTLQNNAEAKLSAINLQQQEYWWGTASLYSFKAVDGKLSSGIVYKPENFDPAKKYPVIFYFYETHTNTLHSYIPPTPTGSRLNVSFFVSRGYIVFSPDIYYTKGHPAKSCYNYVIGAAKQLMREPWVDASNMGIQGQSWGGIQVAQLITMTNLFKAAWAGAPVSNMTSAYGGIRWESGLNRQFQYEKTQSRIGATLWERLDLYLENSPLFHLPKVKTPLVIMANDADGAVPWYQGIELFTGLRRLGKPVWMLNYNGEAHNLRERKNQKDISIREQQFFDWLLKGEKAPRWITEGIPAINKGKDWGLDLVD
jgi:dipeptidyl aminopeptidase/acylaminoacyl peptidase